MADENQEKLGNQENKINSLNSANTSTNQTNLTTSRNMNLNKQNLKRHTAYRFFIGMLLNGNAEFNKEKFLHLIVNNKEVVRVNLFGNVIDKFMNEQGTYCALTIDDGTGTIRVKAFSDSLNIIKNFEQGDTINVIGRLSYYSDEIYIFPEIVKQSNVNWLIARKLELEKEFGKDIIEKISAQLEAREQEEQDNGQGEGNAQETQENNNNNEHAYEPEPVIKKVESSNSNYSGNSNNQGNYVESFDTDKIEADNNNPNNKELTLRDEVLNIIKESEPDGLDIDKLIMSMKKPVNEINNTISELLETAEIYEPKPGRLRIL